MDAINDAAGGASATAAERLYSVSEVAGLWGCSVQHVYLLIAKGEIATVDLSVSQAKTRISESAIAEFVARRSVKQKTGRKPKTAA